MTSGHKFAPAPSIAEGHHEQFLTAAVSILALVYVSFARVPDKREDQEARIRNAGKVMEEILDIPVDVPQDLLDKARCVVVLPSMLQAAFVIGGSYGRG